MESCSSGILSGKEMGKGTKQTSQTAIEKRDGYQRSLSPDHSHIRTLWRNRISRECVYVHAHMCVCVYMCVSIRERE